MLMKSVIVPQNSHFFFSCVDCNFFFFFYKGFDRHTLSASDAGSSDLYVASLLEMLL